MDWFLYDRDLRHDKVNPLSANFLKWSSNTLKQFVGNLPTNCLCVFDHFVGLALKGLSKLLLRNGLQTRPKPSNSAPKKVILKK